MVLIGVPASGTVPWVGILNLSCCSVDLGQGPKLRHSGLSCCSFDPDKGLRLGFSDSLLLQYGPRQCSGLDPSCYTVTWVTVLG